MAGRQAWAPFLPGAGKHAWQGWQLLHVQVVPNKPGRQGTAVPISADMTRLLAQWQQSWTTQPQ